MSIVQWFLIGIGSAAYMVAWRYMAGIIAWDMVGGYRKPGTGEIVFGILIGFVGAVAAPVMLAVRCGRGRGVRDFVLNRALYTPADRRADG